MLRKDFEKTISFSLPIAPWLRKQLNIIETFVQEGADLSDLPSSSEKDSVYKPLWKGERMYIPVSPLCTFARRNSKTGVMETVDRDSLGDNGKYTISLQVSYVYIGPHKKGEDFSLNLSIVQVVFKPEVSPETPVKPPPKKRKGNVAGVLPLDAKA